MYNELVSVTLAVEQIDQIQIEETTILLIPIEKERQSLNIIVALSLTCQELLWHQ